MTSYWMPIRDEHVLCTTGASTADDARCRQERQENCNGSVSGRLFVGCATCTSPPVASSRSGPSPGDPIWASGAASMVTPDYGKGAPEHAKHPNTTSPAPPCDHRSPPRRLPDRARNRNRGSVANQLRPSCAAVTRRRSASLAVSRPCVRGRPASESFDVTTKNRIANGACYKWKPCLARTTHKTP